MEVLKIAKTHSAYKFLKPALILLLMSVAGDLQPLLAQEKPAEHNMLYMTTVDENKMRTKGIFLADNPQLSYQLELRNGKPYAGYQVTQESLLDEYPFVDYYENGVRRARYAVDFLREVYDDEVRNSLDPEEIEELMALDEASALLKLRARLQELGFEDLESSVTLEKILSRLKPSKIEREIAIENFPDSLSLDEFHSSPHIESFYKPLKFDLKTTYVDGKITDGYGYRVINNNTMITDLWHANERTGMWVDMYAMHAFLRMSFQLAGDELVIKEWGTGDSLLVYKKDGLLLADYVKKGKEPIKSVSPYENIKEGTPNSTTLFLLTDNNEVKKIHKWLMQPEADYDDNSFLSQLFHQFSFEYEGELPDLLNDIDRLISAEEGVPNIIWELGNQLALPHKEQLIGYLMYDEQGKPSEGRMISKNPDNSYTVVHYSDGIKKKEETLTSLASLVLE